MVFDRTTLPAADEVVVLEDLLTGAGAEFVRVRVWRGCGEFVSTVEESGVELAPKTIELAPEEMTGLSAKNTGLSGMYWE